MKIRENNSELFEHIGNLLPSPLTKGFVKAIIMQDSDIRDKISEIMEGYDSTSLDLNYYQRSYSKRVSSLVTYLIGEFGITKPDGKDYYTISDEALTEISKVIIARYKNKWLSLLDTYDIEYNPIKPYSMSTHDEITSDHLESQSSDSADGSSVNSSANLNNVKETDKTSTTNKENNDDNHWGFNSPIKSPVQNTESNSSSETSNDNARNEETLSSENNSYSNNKSSSYERDSTKEREITRSGNIGNKTAPELIEEQRKFLDWIFYDVMFADIDRVLAFPKW